MRGIMNLYACDFDSKESRKAHSSNPSTAEEHRRVTPPTKGPTRCGSHTAITKGGPPGLKRTQKRRPPTARRGQRCAKPVRRTTTCLRRARALRDDWVEGAPFPPLPITCRSGCGCRRGHAGRGASRRVSAATTPHQRRATPAEQLMMLRRYDDEHPQLHHRLAHRGGVSGCGCRRRCTAGSGTTGEICAAPPRRQAFCPYLSAEQPACCSTRPCARSHSGSTSSRAPAGAGRFPRAHEAGNNPAPCVRRVRPAEPGGDGLCAS